MEKKTFMEVIKENKDAIIRRALIVLGTVGGILLVSKVLSDDGSEEIEALEEGNDDVQDAEFTEVEKNEEE